MPEPCVEPVKSTDGIEVVRSQLKPLPPDPFRHQDLANDRALKDYDQAILFNFTVWIPQWRRAKAAKTTKVCGKSETYLLMRALIVTEELLSPSGLAVHYGDKLERWSAEN